MQEKKKTENAASSVATAARADVNSLFCCRCYWSLASFGTYQDIQEKKKERDDDRTERWLQK